MPQKKQNWKWNSKILKEHGKISLKKIFQKHTEFIKNLKLIKKIIIKNYLKIVLKKLEKKL
jgi:hypothetical protein